MRHHKLPLVMPNESAAILAHLPADAQITVTVRVGDWLAAKQAANQGPEYADAAEVARVLGFSATYWARRAKRGVISGAVQDEARRWRLPLEACRAHIRGLRGARQRVPQRPTLVPEYRPRAPRKTKTA